MIKEEDLKTLDNDELELLDFALDHEEEEEDEDEESWTPPASKSKNVETSSVKKIEKPRQCEKVFYLLCLAHSSEERSLCLIKLSSEIPTSKWIIFWNNKTHFFFVFMMTIYESNVAQNE